MANKVTMSICGQEYTLVADESAEYMKKVGALVDQRMDRIQETLHVSQADAAVLAAVNLADELLKNQAAAENLRRQVKNYLDEATQAKNEASELRRQLFKAQQGRANDRAAEPRRRLGGHGSRRAEWGRRGVYGLRRAQRPAQRPELHR